MRATIQFDVEILPGDTADMVKEYVKRSWDMYCGCYAMVGQPRVSIEELRPTLRRFNDMRWGDEAWTAMRERRKNAIACAEWLDGGEP